MHIEISTLHPSLISPTDPDDISKLMTELSGREIHLSHEDITDITEHVTMVIARSLHDDCRIVGKGNINLTCNPKRVEAHALYEQVGFKKIDTTVYRLCL